MIFHLLVFKTKNSYATIEEHCTGWRELSPFLRYSISLPLPRRDGRIPYHTSKSQILSTRSKNANPISSPRAQMTGLDSRTDTILSISVLLTTSDLTPLEPEGITLYINHNEAQLASMSEWCITTHTSTGLTTLCLDPRTSTTPTLAAAQILQYIQTYIPTPRTALLAGNSIHADRAFLMVPPWDAILAHLHYRLFDVSAMKEMVRRWAPPEVLAAAPAKQLRHSAREDVLESIDEARFYMALLKTLGNPGSLPTPALTSVPFSTSAENNAAPAARENGIQRTTNHEPTAAGNGMQNLFPTSFQPDSKQDQEALQRMHRLLNDNASNINKISRGGDSNNPAHGFRTDVP